MDNIESLLYSKDVNGANRWRPTSISSFEKALSAGANIGMKVALRKNICYSLQYLQYIQVQLSELNFTSVLSTQLWKTYIIVSCSIIEGIFSHLLKSNKMYKTKEWQDFFPLKYSNEFTQDNITLRYQISTQQKLKTPIEDRMDLNEMINKVEHKKILSLNHGAFPYLRALRSLRNRVHLQISERAYDTDYFTVSKDEYIVARCVLYKVITDKVFELNDNAQVFDWIYPNNDEILAAFSHIRYE